MPRENKGTTECVKEKSSALSVYLPPRFAVAIVCFAALVIAYCDRVNIAVAAPQMMQQRHWNTAQMSWVLSGFFLGYSVFLIPSGILVQQLGAHRLFCYSVAGWSVLTAMTPAPKTLAGLYAMRFLLGIFESSIFPCMNSLLAAWFPQHEYAKAAGFCWSGGYAGPILAFPLAGMILCILGWPSVFYFFGGCGILWTLICWKVLAISPVGKNGDIVSAAMPESGILTGFSLLQQRAVWAVFVLHFSSNWFIYSLLTWLPTYLANVRHFSSAMVAIPFLAALLTANGFAIGITKLSLHFDRTLVRKSMLVPYGAGAAIFILMPKIQSPLAVIAALVASTALVTAATPVYAAGSMEIAPRAAGIFAGMQQAFANVAGVVATLVAGHLARTSWSHVFWVTGAACLTGAVAYAAFGSAEAILPEIHRAS